MSLLIDEIRAKVPQDLIDAKEHGQIALIVSEGRTAPSGLQVGKGTILETLGLERGNVLLDIIDTDPLFRHVRHLLENGWLEVSSPMVLQMLQYLVATNQIAQEDADALLPLTIKPAPVSVQDVIIALEG